MLLGEQDRFSADIDVAAPYSVADERTLASACREIGLPLNPPETFDGDHLEWVGPMRLCLAVPTAETTLVLWQGRYLTIFTLPPVDLVASKLIRYDPTDQADIQFLIAQGRVSLEQVNKAVERLPESFRNDALVRDNLRDLQHDFARWSQ